MGLQDDPCTLTLPPCLCLSTSCFPHEPSSCTAPYAISIRGLGLQITSEQLHPAQVYYVAKQCSSRCSPEEYATALGKHFVSTYPKVSHWRSSSA